jgi:hypothetical protein
MIMYDRMKRRIFLVGLILSASLYWGVPETACPHTSVRESIQNVKTGQQLSLKVPKGQGFVAEEEQPRPEEEKKTLPETPKPKTEPAKKGWPLKKFVPSEKIPADQAVDFPADI